MSEEPEREGRHHVHTEVRYDPDEIRSWLVMYDCYEDCYE